MLCVSRRAFVVFYLSYRIGARKARRESIWEKYAHSPFSRFFDDLHQQCLVCLRHELYVSCASADGKSALFKPGSRLVCLFSASSIARHFDHNPLPFALPSLREEKQKAGERITKAVGI